MGAGGYPGGGYVWKLFTGACLLQEYVPNLFSGGQHGNTSA